MAIKTYKPITPARRGMTTKDTSAVTKNNPTVKKLRTVKKSQAGRNNQGRITTRHRGGGAKKFYRNVNFNLPEGTIATIEDIQYDPNRTANIALVKDQNGQMHYVLANSKMKVGDKISTGKDLAIEPGNRLTMANIPAGTFIYDIELTPGRGGQMVRSAGAKAQLLAKEGEYGQVRLPSGEVRKILLNCMATIGSVGNEQHQNIKYGSAGRRRRMGRRPSVRGVVMNAVDHPHGGGDGGSHGPGRDPKTPWGQLTLGYKTRRRKSSDKFIVRSRSASKRK